MLRSKTKILSLILIFVLAVCLSGCRKSPALVDDVYTEHAKEIDREHTVTDQTEDAEPDEEMSPIQQEQSADERNDQEQTESRDAGIASGQTMDDSIPAININPVDQSGTEVASAGGGDQQTRDNMVGGEKGGNTQGTGEGGGSGENQGDVSDTSDNQHSGQDDTPSSGDADTGATDSENTDPAKNPENDPISSDQPGDSGVPEPTVKDVPRKIVTDGNGVERDVPKDVYTVTAVGDAAPIVEMIGGSGRLLATSQSFTDTNGLGYALCSDVQSGQVQTWWYEDGTNPIEDAYFQELLRQSPDVCFEVSGQTTFTSEQIAELQAHGIGYVPLPDLTSLDRMKQAVAIVANTLEVNAENGIDSRKIADNYAYWLDNVISELNGRRPNEVYGTFYVTQWRDDITFQRMYDPAEDNPYVEFPGMEGGYGYGVALTWSDYKRQPLWEVEISAGIYPCERYASMSYDPTPTERNPVGTWKASFAESDLTECYVFPYEASFGIPVFSDDRFHYVNKGIRPEKGPYVSSFVNTLGGVYFTNGDYWANSDNNIVLGHDRYPAIIVASDFIRSWIQSSPQWKAGYSPNPYDNPIHGDYAIYVNPTGFRNWAEGGVDAPLEGYWLSARITKTIDESLLYNRIRNFYESFFGVRLSDTQISAIINR